LHGINKEPTKMLRIGFNNANNPVARGREKIVE